MNWGLLFLQGGIWLRWDPKKSDILFLSYCTNKASFHNYLWWSFKPSQMFFGVRCFFGRQTWRCETTCLSISNLDWISSIYILCYLFLMNRLISTLDFPQGFWWKFSSSSAPWIVIVSSRSISMVQKFLLTCVGSL